MHGAQMGESQGVSFQLVPLSNNSEVVDKKSAPLKTWEKIAITALVIFAAIGIAAAIVFFGFPALLVTIALPAAVAITAMAVGGVCLFILLGAAAYKRHKAKTCGTIKIQGFDKVVFKVKEVNVELANRKNFNAEKGYLRLCTHGTKVIYIKSSDLIQKMMIYQDEIDGAGVNQEQILKKLIARKIKQQADTEMIQKALGVDVKKGDYKTAFSAKHQVGYDKLMRAAIAEMAKVRLSNQQAATATKFAGGFKRHDIAQWKFTVVMDSNGKITELCIGNLKAEGTHTKVYFTLHDVIKVSKKHEQAQKDLLNADEMGQHLWGCNDQFIAVNDQRAIDPDLLPPIPRQARTKKNKIIYVTSKAMPVEKRFEQRPTNIKETVSRLKVLRDVAKGIAFLHEVEMVHADVKPANMLISQGKGQITDLGGSHLMRDAADLKQMRESQVTRSSDYTYYPDKLLLDRTSKVSKVAAIEKALDVYALGLSTIEALIGMERNGDQIFPLQDTSYKIVGKAYYANSGPEGRTNVSIPGKQANIILQELLNNALNTNYKKRLSAKNFAKQLDRIIILLSKK